MLSIDLRKSDFSQSAFLRGVLPAEGLIYQGYLTGKIQQYQIVVEPPAVLWVAHLIRREEADFWFAARDVIDTAVKTAATVVRGTYSFELLSFDPENELKTFNVQELAQVIINTARALKPGQTMVVRYSSVYGFIQKFLDEAWGKMTFRTAVVLLDSKPRAFIDLLSSVLKSVDSQIFPGILLFNDISQTPLFCPQADEEQGALLNKLAIKRAKNVQSVHRDVLVRDKNGLRRVW